MEQVVAMGEWILAKEIPRPEKIGSIFVPEDVKNPKKEKAKRVKILSIGKKVEDPTFKVGDTVFVYIESGTKIEDFGLMIKESNIMCAIIEEDAIEEDNCIGYVCGTESLEYKAN